MGTTTKYIQMAKNEKVEGGLLVLTRVGCTTNCTIDVQTPWGGGQNGMYFAVGQQHAWTAKDGSTYSVKVGKVDCTPGWPALAYVTVVYNQAPQPGKITCMSSPTGADIFLNGNKQSAKTNITLTGVSPGNHTVKFTLAGYKDYSTTVSVKNGETATVSTTLEANIQATTLTLNQPTKTTVTEGENLTLSGHLRDASGMGILGAEVRFYDADLTTDDPLKDASGSDLKVITGPNGVFMVNWPAANMDAEYGLSRANVVAKFAGTTAYKASQSSEYLITIIKKEPEPTTLTVTVSPTSAEVGTPINISGYLKTSNGTPISGATIKLYDNDAPTGKQELKNLSTPLVATTNSSGYFSINWLSEKMDSWDWTTEVIAVYEGSATYKASQSAEAVVTLKEKGLVPTRLLLDPFNPDYVVAETEVRLTGKLSTTNGKDVPYAQVYFEDIDQLTANDKLLVNGKVLKATTNKYGNYSVFWPAERMDLGKTLKIRAVFDGDAEHSKSISSTQELKVRSDILPTNIRSYPTGARIYIDDKDIGLYAPTTINLQAGKEYKITGRIDQSWYNSILPEDWSGNMPLGYMIPEVTVVHKTKVENDNNTVALEFKEPSAVCKLLGTTTISECNEWLKIGLLDVAIEINSLNKIVHKKSLYTGEPAEATTWDYMAVALSLVTLPAAPFKVFGKVALKMGTTATRIIKAAQIEPRIFDIMNETHFFARLTGMTENELDTIVQAVNNVLNNPGGAAREKALRDLAGAISRVQLDHIPNKQLEEIRQQLLKVMPEKEAAAAMEKIEYFFRLGVVESAFGIRFADMFSTVLNGSYIMKLEDVSEFVKHAVNKPDEVLDLVERIGLTTAKATGDKIYYKTPYGGIFNTLMLDIVEASLRKVSLYDPVTGKLVRAGITNNEALSMISDSARIAEKMLDAGEYNKSISNAINKITTGGGDYFYLVEPHAAREFETYLRELLKKTSVGEYAAKLSESAVVKAERFVQSLEKEPRVYAAVVKNGGGAVKAAAKATEETAAILSPVTDVAPIHSAARSLHYVSRTLDELVDLNFIYDTELAACFQMSREFMHMPFGETVKSIEVSDNVRKLATRYANQPIYKDGKTIGRLHHKSHYEDLAESTSKSISRALSNIPIANRKAETISSIIFRKLDELRTAAKTLMDEGIHVSKKTVDDMPAAIKDTVPRLADDAAEFSDAISEFIRLFKRLADGDYSVVVDHNLAKQFAKLLRDDPAGAFKVLDEIEYAKTMNALIRLGAPGEVVRQTLRVLNAMRYEPTEESLAIIGQYGKLVLQTYDITSHHSMPALLRIVGSMFETGDKLRKFDDLFKTNYYGRVGYELQGLSVLNPSTWKNRVGWFLGDTIHTIYMHRRFSMLIGAFIAFELGMIVYMIMKSFGIAPGDRSYRFGDMARAIEKQYWLCKQACEQNLESSPRLIEEMKSMVDEMQRYREDNLSTLSREMGGEEMVNACMMPAIEQYEMIVATCTPAELPNVESGILEDVIINEVTDGDTLIVTWTDPETGKVYKEFKVRLLGINTPEAYESKFEGCRIECTEGKGVLPKIHYVNANNYLLSLISNNRVTLKTNKERSEDSYNRLLAIVYKPDGTDVNKEMLQKGLGCYFHRPEWEVANDIIPHEEYKAARDYAKQYKLGIWSHPWQELTTGSVVFKAFMVSSTGSTSGTPAEVWSYPTEEMGSIYLHDTSTSSEKTWAEGDHKVIFRKEGYVEKVCEFTVEYSRTTVASVTWSAGDKLDESSDETPGEGGTPSGNTGIVDFAIYRQTSTNIVGTTATVYEGEKYLFQVTTTKNGHETSVGMHSYTIKKDGHADITETIDVKKGTRHLISVTLQPTDGEGGGTHPGDDPNAPAGKLDVLSKPTYAAIYIDERYVGLTKKAGITLAAGSRKVTLRKSGYVDWHKTITVVAGESQVIDAELVKDDDLGASTPYIPGTGAGYPTYMPGFAPKSTTTSFPAFTGGGGGQTSEPEKEPWSELLGPVKLTIVTLGEPSEKQEAIVEEVEKFLEKHSKLDIKVQKVKHPAMKLQKDLDGNAALDKPEHIMKRLKEEEIPDDTKILYLLWSPDGVKEVSYDGTTNGIDEDVWGAVLCSSPNTGKDYPFNGTTGRLVNERLKVTYQGTITMLLQITDALHEIYNSTRDTDAQDLPELDKEFCEREYHDKRANAKCIVAWLRKLNANVPGLED